MTTAVFEWLGSSRNLEFILEGFATNPEIAVMAIILSLPVGLALALMRLSRNRIEAWGPACGWTPSATCC